MIRLPHVGGDEGGWGDLLNNFLLVEHNSNGTLKTSGSLASKYTKPSNGIPSSDLDAAVQTSLGKADSALQAADISGKVDKSLVTSKGDLMVGVSNASIARLGIGTDNQVLTADSSQTAGIKWSTPSTTDNAAVHKGDLVINVKDYGAVGNGVADDTTAIQNAINASDYGGRVYFPKGTYKVSSTILLKPSRTYFGASREFSVIKMADGANLDAVIASETWQSGTLNDSDNPINIHTLGVSGNKSNQTSGLGIGIAIISFWNQLENLEITNTLGDGLLLTSKRKDGFEVSGSAGVENHIERCDIRNAGGHAIHVQDPTPGNQSVTDGWIIDCIVENTGLDAIKIESAAGWHLQGNHLYVIPQNGIHVSRASYTRIIGNYIEPWGSTATAGVWSAITVGDGASTFSVGQVVIMGNVAYMGSQSGGTTIYGINANTSNGQLAHYTIVGNTLLGNGFNKAIHVANQGVTASSYVKVNGNVATGWAQRMAFGTTGTMVVNGDSYPNAVATTATDGFARLPSVAGTPTGTPGDTTEGIPTLVDVNSGQIWAYYSASWHIVGSGASAANYASITAQRPSSVESGSYMVTAPGSTGLLNTWTLGFIYLAPFDVRASQTFTGLGTNVNVVGAGGTSPLVHLGLYNDDGSGSRPTGAVISGTEVSFNPVSSGTGDIFTAWSSPITLPAGRYWCGWALTSSTAMSTQPTIVTLNPSQNIGLATLGNSSLRGWGYSAGNFTNMPTLGTLTRAGNSWPIMGMKAQ